MPLFPLRGGSTKYSRKNIRLLNGQTLIAFPLKTAFLQGYSMEVIVSRNDLRLLKISRICGGLNPFLRPANLATIDRRQPPVDAARYAGFLINEGKTPNGRPALIYAIALF